MGQQQPQISGSVLEQAINSHKKGMLLDAEKLYLEAISADPKNYQAYRYYGTLLSHLRRAEDAINTIRQAIDLEPENIDAYQDLANIYNALASNLEYQEELKNTYQSILKLEPDHIETLMNLTKVLISENKFDEVINQCNKIIELSPNEIEAYTILGITLDQIGKKQEALDILYKALELDPKHAYTFYCLVLAKAHRQDQGLAGKIEALIQDQSYFESLNYNNRAHLLFALAKIYDSNQEYDKAFELYNKANTTIYNAHKYDIKNEEAKFNNIKSAINQDFFNKKYQEVLDSKQDSQPHPIFILGMPRSGTSLVEQILDSHSEVIGAGELSFLPRIINNILPMSRSILKDLLPDIDAAGYLELGQEYMTQLSQYGHNSKFICDKLPSNFIYLGLIKLMLPNAKIIHCSRNPIDTCLSYYKHFFPPQDQLYSFNLSDLAKFYKLYQDLMQHWQDIMPQGSFYTIVYENLVENPQVEIRALLDYCQLDWQDSCLEFHANTRTVHTASREQVNQPLYSSSINNWQKYEKYLSELINTLN